MLTRRGSAVSAGPAWIGVSASRPCPCCGAASDCSFGDGAAFVHCLKMVSEHPMLGGGWLHVVSGPPSGTLAGTSGTRVDIA